MTRPRERIESACRRLGRDRVVEGCCVLIAGGSVDPGLLVVLGGPAAVRYLDDGQPESSGYWPRVWGARGLLWAGVGDRTPDLAAALGDDHWRVREMACKVVARHRLGDVLDTVAGLETDPVDRVRTAAARAVVRIVEAQS